MTRISQAEVERRRYNRQRRQDHLVCGMMMAAAVAGTVALFHEKGADVLGDHDHPISPAVAIQKNTKEYKRRFRAANSASKFAMQYANVIAVGSDASTPGVRLLSSHRDLSSDRHVSYFNNACLKGSVYDLSKASLLTRNASNEEGAVVSSDESYSVVTVTPRTGPELKLEVDMEAASLEPASFETEQVLVSYGCKSGIQSTESVWIPRPTSTNSINLRWVTQPSGLQTPTATSEYSPQNLVAPFNYVK